MLNKFWLNFGKTEKIGMTNFAAILAGVVAVTTTAINKGKLPIELRDWLDILSAIATVLLGFAGGRSSNLNGPQ